MANENTEYEKLTQEIYQAINCAEGVKNINVQHNIKLSGKSGCNHQIDVYWEFEMMGETHKVAIECKNYSEVVSVGRIRDFFGVLHDVGDVKGIFVTKEGYQSGAKKFGDHYGISLKELRCPKEQDWEGRVKNIVLNLSAISTELINRTLDLDIDWLEKNTNYKEGDQLNLSGMQDEIIIVKSDGSYVSDFYKLESNLPHDNVEETGRKYTEKFEDSYLTFPAGEKLKINSIVHEYNVVVSTQTSITEGEKVAKAILKDVSSGKIKFYDNKGQVRNVRCV